MEVQDGFEPTNQGVADPCLTTWLLDRYLSLTFIKNTVRFFLQYYYIIFLLYFQIIILCEELD